MLLSQSRQYGQRILKVDLIPEIFFERVTVNVHLEPSNLVRGRIWRIRSYNGKGSLDNNTKEGIN